MSRNGIERQADRVRIAGHKVRDVYLEIRSALRMVCREGSIVQTVQRSKHHTRSPPKSMVAFRVDEAWFDISEIPNRDRSIHGDVGPQLDNIIEFR